MAENFYAINLPLPMHTGSVNVYLVQISTGYILIDTGNSSSRKQLDQELRKVGCLPGLIQLVILTHGDFDHIGNAAYIRSIFGARIAMHRHDVGMAENGDMFYNRKQPNLLIRALLPIFTRFGSSERFTPDILVDDGYDLSQNGYEARILSLPGHSKGSIGILTPDGNLFCGDLFENSKSPRLNSLMDDPDAAQTSLARLRKLDINMVYPGHGKPFPLELLEN